MRITARKSALTSLAAIGILVAVLGWGGARWAKGKAGAEALSEAAQTARLHNGLLASEMQKFRLLPVVLAEYPDVAGVLSTSGSSAERRLDMQLEQLAQRTDAAAIYLIDANGQTRAASNWRLPTSFVGQNYAFRPYFRDAMVGGASELFALGTVSGRPGLYLAKRVDRDGRALGAIVVKVEFDRVEANWGRATGFSVVTDSHGVVLVTSDPAWRFGATRPLDQVTLADAQRTLQFGNTPPRRLPIDIEGDRAVVTGVDGRAVYRLASVPAPIAGARLTHLAPMAGPLAAAHATLLSWALLLAILVASAVVLLVRQRERQRLLREARAGLEREVEKRTNELRETNARFELAREELARANRLGTLGQITAGVAHEINQPVAAIRMFAENGQALLERNSATQVRENLSRIVSLTERIGAITAELRSFTRRKTPSPVQAQLGSVLDGTMLLIGEAARGVVTVDVTDAQRGALLLGDRVRLEQVLINLVRNALDAVEGQERAAIRIAVDERPGGLDVTVSDNGPGVDLALRDSLFDPFETGKPGGLGLGLAIARDIAREFGGDIVLLDTAVGAAFLLTLGTAR